MEILVKRLYFVLLTLLVISCNISTVEIRLEGNVFGYQDGDYCTIIFNVKNYGDKSVLGVKASIIILESGTEALLDAYNEYLGDFLPGEIRKFESDLPRQFKWGDDINIRMEFRWEN
jgi:hypothetical protein